MVGDTYVNDITPARDIGMKTVWLTNRTSEEFRSLTDRLAGRLSPPDLTCNTVADLCVDDFIRLVNR